MQEKIVRISAQKSKKWSNQRNKGKFLQFLYCIFGKFKAPKFHSEIDCNLELYKKNTYFCSIAK